MGYVVKFDGYPVTILKLHGSSSDFGCDIGFPYFGSPIILQSRLEADLFAAFLALRYPVYSPFSVHETVKVTPVLKVV